MTVFLLLQGVSRSNLLLMYRPFFVCFSVSSAEKLDVPPSFSICSCIRDVSTTCVEEQAHSSRESREVYIKCLFHRLQSQRTVSIFHLPVRLLSLVLTERINKIYFIFVFKFCMYLFRRFIDYWTVFFDGPFLINKYVAWWGFHLERRAKGKKEYIWRFWDS